MANLLYNQWAVRTKLLPRKKPLIALKNYLFKVPKWCDSIQGLKNIFDKQKCVHIIITKEKNHCKTDKFIIQNIIWKTYLLFQWDFNVFQKIIILLTILNHKYLTCNEYLLKVVTGCTYSNILTFIFQLAVH